MGLCHLQAVPEKEGEEMRIKTVGIIAIAIIIWGITILLMGLMK